MKQVDRTIGKLIATIAVVVLGCGTPTSASPPDPSEPRTIKEALRLETDRPRFEAALVTLAASEDPAISRQAQYLLGRLYLTTDRYPEAAALLETASTSSKLLAPWILLDLAETQSETGDLEGAIGSLDTIRSKHQDSAPVVAATIRVLPLLVRHDTERVEAATQSILELSLDDATEHQLVTMADELDEIERFDLSARIRIHMLEEYPNGRYVERTFGNVEKPAGGKSPLSGMKAAELDELAAKLARYNRLDQALDLLELAEKQSPSAARRDDSVALRVQVLFKARRYTQVTQTRIASSSKHYEEVQYLRALAYWRTDRNELFLEAIENLIKAKPGSAKAAEARVLLAKFHAVEDKDFAKAAKVMGDAVKLGAAGSGGENLWLTAWYQILANQDEVALASLEQYLGTYPDASYTANALFWRGRLLNSGGDTPGSRAAFTELEEVRPYDYFTWRARELDLLDNKAPSRVESGTPFPPLEPVESLGDDRISRALELESLGMLERAVFEWRLAQRAHKGNASLSLGLADLYARAGLTSKSMSIALGEFRDVARHGSPNAPAEFWKLLYPRAHWPLITREAKRNGIDPWLVAAIIRQESGFEPTIVSSAGAVGLMQIMPKDASRIASTSTLGRRVRRSELFDVETSIILGTHEFANKLKRMDGNEILAIAAYNAGEDAVDKWVREIPIDDIDRFIESIPYPETRLYVKIVLKNRNEYRRVYGE